MWVFKNLNCVLFSRVAYNKNRSNRKRHVFRDVTSYVLIDTNVFLEARCHHFQRTLILEDWAMRLLRNVGMNLPAFSEGISEDRDVNIYTYCLEKF
jgi:hypothetical protein